jgi:plasmid replication initiation protein
MTSNLIITKANQLIRQSGYELSLIEQRILLLCIGKMDSMNKTVSNVFTLSVDDFNAELGLSKDNVYNNLNHAVKRLYERDIYLDPTNPDSKSRWIYRKIHTLGEGKITISFTPEIMFYLSELKTCFTSYKLKDVAEFESSYSFRFYELLMSWKNKTELKVEVSWIREALQLGDKYPDIYNLKRKVINPALTDINAFSNLNVTLIKQIKIGKKITHFIFKYEPKTLEKKPIKITRALIEEHARPGETYQQVHDRLLKNQGKKP